MVVIPTLENAKIAVIGLGYVGLPLAAEFAKKRAVMGFDINQERVDEITKGTDRTGELTEEEMASAVGLRATTDVESLRECDVYIVTVPTPIDVYKKPDLRPLISASKTVGGVLNAGDVVIYESTVYPGCTEDDCVPVLEAESKLSFNKDFFCGYSPERINPGDREHRVADIKKVTSGSTEPVAEFIDQLYASIITAGTHPAPSIKVAEAAKVIENTQRDLNIALMNELSVIFDRINIDTVDVLQAAGTKWNFLPFRPGLVGGHCIGVDPYYLTHKAESIGYSPQVILSGRRINDNMGRYAARKTVQLMLANGIDVARSKVGVMGVTFKENCPDIRNSKVIDVIEELQKWGVPVVVVDPWADGEDVRREYGLELGLIDPDNPVDALILAVAHDDYRQMTVGNLKQLIRGDRPIVLDLKSVFDQKALKEHGMTVFRL